MPGGYAARRDNNVAAPHAAQRPVRWDRQQRILRECGAVAFDHKFPDAARIRQGTPLFLAASVILPQPPERAQDNEYPSAANQ